jgi:XTP/dITP diphosphohydrolase
LKILLGTKNGRKIPEFLHILADLSAVHWLTYQDCPFRDVEEDGRNFEENALKKARQIGQETGLAVLAEDSGLEVEALGGQPGIYSARFAGAADERPTDQQNIQKLLRLLEGVEERNARFVCVAVLRFADGNELISQGELRGRIAPQPRGMHGFGYDPVFIPAGYEQTLAELGPSVKDAISHRRRALQKLKSNLSQLAAQFFE